MRPARRRLDRVRQRRLEPSPFRSARHGRIVAASWPKRSPPPALAPSKNPNGRYWPLPCRHLRRARRLTAWQGWQGSAFARVRRRSLAQAKSLQTAWLSEQPRTCANARWHLPCRRSGVRVPSSALKSLQNRTVCRPSVNAASSVARLARCAAQLKVMCSARVVD
jgi:hypothetical protein